MGLRRYVFHILAFALIPTSTQHVADPNLAGLQKGSKNLAFIPGFGAGMSGTASMKSHLLYFTCICL